MERSSVEFWRDGGQGVGGGMVGFHGEGSLPLECGNAAKPVSFKLTPAVYQFDLF